MVTKSFKTLDEQIEILKNKKLVIGNENYAKDVLLRENYFFLNGYRHLFMDPNNQKVFVEGTRFEEVYSLFLFDRSLRNIMFKYILVIENNLKSIISYVLSKKYGYKEKEYLKVKNFSSDPSKQKQIRRSYGWLSTFRPRRYDSLVWAKRYEMRTNGDYAIRS